MKTKILTFIICSMLFACPFGGICKAQNVHQEWVQRINGPFNDLIGPFLQVDKNGNSYVAGTHVVNDSVYILAVKYNSAGVEQWVKIYKHPDYATYAPGGLAIDSLGNAYVTSFCSEHLFTPEKILTVRFNNSDGSVQWAKIYSGQYGISSEPGDIKIDRNNNIYVVGYADSSLLCIKYNTNGDSLWVRQHHVPNVLDGALVSTIDDSSNIIMTGKRLGTYCDTMLTVKYSPDGIFRWAKTFRYGSSNQTDGTNIVTDQNGSVYIGGRTRISGYFAYLTLKYDRNGVQQWIKIFDPPGSGDNVINSIAYDFNNNFLLVAGYASINNTYFATILKYNINNGDTIWVKAFNGPYINNAASAISIDTIGNCYVTGATEDATSTIMDILTFKIAANGTQIWSIIYNGPYNGWDNGKDISIDYQNNLYVLGTSQSGFQVSDYIVIKYSQPSGIKKISSDIPYKFALNQNYPNPFNPTTKIKFDVPSTPPFTKGDQGGLTTLIIYDILGREITTLVNQKLQPGTYEVEWNGSNYPSGVYFYKLQTESFNQTNKMVLLK